MFVSEKPENYEKVYQELLADLGRLNLAELGPHLGGQLVETDSGASLKIRLLGRDYLVGPAGVTDDRGDRPHFTVRIVLSYYLLRQGSGPIAGSYIAYRETEGAFFNAFFQAEVEQRLVRSFQDRPEKLVAAAQALGGRPGVEGLGGDITLTLPALPKITLAVIFYEADDEFPASATLLFDANAERFLDPECLAVLGQITVAGLEKAAERV